MAEHKGVEDVEEEDITVLAMTDVVANGNGTCSVMLGGWEAKLSDDSVGRN